MRYIKKPELETLHHDLLFYTFYLQFHTLL